MDTRRKTLGRRLKRARLAAGYRSQRAFADAIGVHERSVAGAETGEERTGTNVFTAIEIGLRLPDEITTAYLETGDPGLLERIAFDSEQDRPKLPPDMPADEDDDGWTDDDEAFYQALTELLKRQGLKPTPAIIQAMREEWEREHAEQSERHESDETG